MEKMSWKQVRQSNRNNNVPNARWGHSCCVIEDQVIFFGGYADSNYMNDVWTFNTITMEWNEVETTGDIPSPRSNCSMNFDKQNNRIIVFGGGGPNKVRYNTINILDWKTKEWKEIFPKENQPAPWERTYHTAELFSHYLITFGGEGISDLEDLWIYDFTGMKWTEVLVSKSAIRPCARRFHSSALVNNEFFVIAGCYGKYRCLSDIYSIDLTSFLENGKVDNLQWKDRKMKDYTFLTRWGHTSAVYENKICVFGGRFCNDLNDILIVDPCKDQINLLKVSGQLPKPRRRHSACFLGSSMLVFGGFNGEYYNDLHYISIKLPKKKLSIDDNITNESVRALRRLKAVQWQLIETKNGDKYQICVGLLIPRFKSIYSFDRFLRQIDGKYYKQQLQDLLLSLNRGYGKIDLSLAIQYEITIFETKQQLNLSFKNTIMEEQTQILSVAKRFKGIQPVILLDQERYSTYLQQKRCQQCYFDITLNINNQAYFRANKALLAVNSQYFANMFSHHYSQNQQIVKMLVNDVVLFETFLNYLTTNFIVASATATHTFWIGMLELADYYSVDSLMKICENQLLSYVSQYSCQELLIFALKMSLSDLASACSQQIVKRMVGLNRDHDEQLILQKQNEFIYLQRQKVLKKVYNNQRFDILQKRINTEEKEQISSLKKKQKDSSQNYQEQKQNNQIKN